MTCRCSVRTPPRSRTPGLEPRRRHGRPRRSLSCRRRCRGRLGKWAAHARLISCICDIYVCAREPETHAWRRQKQLSKYITFEVVDEGQAAVVHGGLQQRSKTPRRADAHHVKPGFLGVREGGTFR